MRVTLRALTGALAAAVAASAAQGQVVPFAGCTSFAFDAPAPMTPCGTFQSATLGGYTFENATFSGVTASDPSIGAGVAILNGPMNGPGGIELDNFGALYGDGTPFDYTGHTLHVRIQFTGPGPGNLELVGSLSGIFDPPPSGTGSPFLTFLPGSASFTFDDGVMSGTVVAGVHNYAVGTFAAGPFGGVLTIRLDQVVTPEPRSALLVALGLAAMLGARLRGRSRH
jgi:hypothetical protein